MSPRKPEAVQAAELQKHKIRDWFMAGANFLAPLTATVVGVFLTTRFHDPAADGVTAPHWKPDGGEVVLVAIIILAVSVAFYLWIQRRLKEIVQLRSGLAAKESELVERDKETVEFRSGLAAKETELTQRGSEIVELRSGLAQSHEECAELCATLQDRERRLESASAIRMIHPAEYMDILRKLADTHGAGHLLLFNIELNTFGDDNVFEQLWGRLAEVSEIKTVRMALPRPKFERWETIVTGVREGFFGEPTNGRKFVACEYAHDNPRVEDRIAFALYDSIRDPRRRDWGALFLLNRPFIEERAGGVHDYLHILEYRGANDVLSRCRKLWDRVYESDWAETAEDIQKFKRHLREPPTLGDLLKQHRCDRGRREVITRVVGTKRVVEDEGKYPRPLDLPTTKASPDGSYSFRIRYRHTPPIAKEDEVVSGTCVGLEPAESLGDRPCVIWSSGFGEGQEPKLAKILSKRLNGHGFDVVEVFFTKSGRIEETTCTRMEEDIKAVVDYAADIPGVDRNGICVIGISLSAYLAARIARRDHRIKSLVLVAPPFDVVEMLDNFRRHYLAGQQRIPTFRDFLKARNNLKISDWDRNPRYCNYFNHIVTSCHLADIAITGSDKLGRSAFLEALGTITRTDRRVALIYGNDDEIVRADENLRHLDAEIENGFIKEDNFYRHTISVAHYYPPQGEVEDYPFRIRDTKALIGELSDAIRHCLNVVTGPGGSVADSGDHSDRPALRVTGS